jgi:hypothetical protein
MEMPCSHEIEDIYWRLVVPHLNKTLFHPRWWLDTEVSPRAYSTYFVSYPGLHVDAPPTEDETPFDGAGVLQQLGSLRQDQRQAAEHAIIKLVNNPANESLRVKPKGRPKGAVGKRLRLPLDVRTAQHIEAFDSSTKRLLILGEDYHEIDVLPSTAPASTLM